MPPGAAGARAPPPVLFENPFERPASPRHPAPRGQGGRWSVRWICQSLGAETVLDTCSGVGSFRGCLGLFSVTGFV